MQGKARRLTFVPLVAMAITAAATGCSDMFVDEESPDAQYAGICVSPQGQRLDDSACGDYDDVGNGGINGSYFLWMPMNSPYPMPGVGQPVPMYIGSRSVPKGTPIAKGAPAKGGSLNGPQRGGFGIKGGTTAGTGAKAGSAGS